MLSSKLMCSKQEKQVRIRASLSPCLDGSGLLWQQKGDEHNIRQAVTMLCLFDVYVYYTQAYTVLLCPD